MLQACRLSGIQLHEQGNSAILAAALGKIQPGRMIADQHQSPAAKGEMPGHQRTDTPSLTCLKHLIGVVQHRVQQPWLLLARQLCGGNHDTKGHFIIGRPDQMYIRITTEQQVSLLGGALPVPVGINQLAQLNLGMLAERPLQSPLAQLRRGGVLDPEKSQHLHRLLTAGLSNQGAGHQVTGLLFVGHHAANPVGILFPRAAHDFLLVSRQRAVDREQLDPGTD